MRAIHTTADFDYADNLVFSPDAVRLGREALRAGARIVTDTRMALAGINKKRLEALGGEALVLYGGTRMWRSRQKSGGVPGQRPVWRKLPGFMETRRETKSRSSLPSEMPLRRW